MFGVHGLSNCGLRALELGPEVVAHRLGCPTACEVLPDQGRDCSPLHWQAGSRPLSRQRSPPFILLKHPVTLHKAKFSSPWTLLFCNSCHRIKSVLAMLTSGQLCSSLIQLLSHVLKTKLYLVKEIREIPSPGISTNIVHLRFLDLQMNFKETTKIFETPTFQKGEGEI